MLARGITVKYQQGSFDGLKHTPRARSVSARENSCPAPQYTAVAVSYCAAACLMDAETTLERRSNCQNKLGHRLLRPCRLPTGRLEGKPLTWLKVQYENFCATRQQWLQPVPKAIVKL